jgi:hypothetical protein
VSACVRACVRAHGNDAGVQRLEVMDAVLLARERRALTARARRRAPTAAARGGRTTLAAALAALPSGVLAMVAEAVAALGYGVVRTR